MRSKLLCCVFALSLPTIAATAQSQQLDETKAAFIALPEAFHQTSGKYPDAHVVLFRVGCGQDSQKNWINQLPPSSDTYTVTLSGSGYKTSNLQRDDDCTVSFDLTTTSTEFGDVAVNVKTAKAQIGIAYLHFADPLAGPIPTKSPQVDVLWAPISYDVCSQAFGRAVAKKFFCIAVKIGNNSGYQLQIAGVGFNTPFGSSTDPHMVKTPNSSYALTR